VQTLTREIIDKGLKNRVLTDDQISRIVRGTPQRRHHLVNRALKAGELTRLRRGLYLLAHALRDYPPHPFALAQSLVPGSYVSFETALAHYGWIPEAVRVTASVTPGRKSLRHEHPILGSFSFHPLAVHRSAFLELVERRQIQQQTMLVAAPIRALMDLVCLRKVAWQGMDWLLGSLRIEPSLLHATVREDLRKLTRVYKQKRVQAFLSALERELFDD
jgi:predicted transcriptional regulator of viral defense system